jgi:hypothetical protein
MTRQISWYAGWLMILSAFAIGAGIGLFFHRDDWWGGYDSWRRRLTRLGHIALVALGALNILYSLGPPAGRGTGEILLAGSLMMPTVCFLSAWKKPLRRLFFIPVTLLFAAVMMILLSGPPR